MSTFPSNLSEWYQMNWLNGIQRSVGTKLGMAGLGVIALVAWATTEWLTPKRLSDAPAEAPVVYDEQISIPKVPGGAKSMNPLAVDMTLVGDAYDQVGLASRWTPIENGDDPGQLLVDLPSIHLWRRIERSARFQYIPPPHTVDHNRNKTILYALINDSFKCGEGTAAKIRLNVYYDDGTAQPYFPWGNASPWRPVEPNTALSREMKFICAVELPTSDSPTSATLHEDRIFGKWQADGTVQGRVAAGPIVISETEVAWTGTDNHPCISQYQLASRSTGPTFPGGAKAGGSAGDTYTTLTLDLKGPHLDPCSKKMNSFTISFASNQLDLAYFTAFFAAPQAYGMMHRVSSTEALAPTLK